jgi:hypothetical protein
MIVEPKVPADGEVQTGRHRRDLLVSTVSYDTVTYDTVTYDTVTYDVVEQPAMNVARHYRYRWR